MYSTQLHLTDAQPRGHQPKPLSEVDTAGPADFDDLIRFLSEVRDELKFDDDLLLVETVAALACRQHGVALIVRGSTRQQPIEASVGLYLMRLSPLSRRYRLVSVWNVVAPDHRRRTGHAKSLLLATNDFAARLGDQIFFNEWVQPDSPKGKLCSRHLNLVMVGYSTTPPSHAA